MTRICAPAATQIWRKPLNPLGQAGSPARSSGLTIFVLCDKKSSLESERNSYGDRSTWLESCTGMCQVVAHHDRERATDTYL
jgi:hypothetical protein